MTEQKKGAIIIVFGPQGCGKTRMSHLLQEYYQADRVIDNGIPLLNDYSVSTWATLDSQASVGLRVIVLTNEDGFNREVVEALSQAHPLLVSVASFAGWLGNYQGLRTEAAMQTLDQHWSENPGTAGSFVFELEALADNIHEANKKVGWWDELEGLTPRFRKMLFAEKLALAHSEVTETLEGIRKDLFDDKLPWRRMAEVEISDAIIRLMDLAKGMGLEVGAPLIEKLAFNANRADHKRENREAPGGKAF